MALPCRRAFFFQSGRVLTGLAWVTHGAEIISYQVVGQQKKLELSDAL
jgi:hypothetical protein